MSARPFMQLYVGDYLRDTAHLTAEQHGAYLLLLMALWTRGGSLPADQNVIRQVARVERRKWPDVWDAISSFFTDDGNGGWTQKRIQQELRKAAEIGEKRRESGKRGGDARALKSASNSLAIASVLPLVLPANSQPFAGRLLKHSHIPDKITLTTSEQEPAPVEAKEAASPAPADERRKKLDAALRRMGRLKDGRDEEAA